MKRGVLFLVIAVLCFAVISGAVERYAKNMIDGGAMPSDLLIEAMDENCAAVYSYIVACIDSVSEIAKNPVHVDLDWPSTARDTAYHYVMTVPVGMTATIRAAGITAHIPPVGAVGSDSILMYMYFYDASKPGMCKYATTQRLSDSAQVTTLPGILVADSTEVMSIDSVTTFAAGDVLYIATWADTALGGPENGCGVTFDIDFDE